MSGWRVRKTWSALRVHHTVAGDLFSPLFDGGLSKPKPVGSHFFYYYFDSPSQCKHNRTEANCAKR